MECKVAEAATFDLWKAIDFLLSTGTICILKEYGIHGNILK